MPKHPSFPWTDEQAEVLIPDDVKSSGLQGVAVHSETRAQRELVRFRQCGMDPPTLLVVSEFFDARRLSARLRQGDIPPERL